MKRDRFTSDSPGGARVPGLPSFVTLPVLHVVPWPMNTYQASPAEFLLGGIEQEFREISVFSETMILNLKSQSLDDAVKKWKILVSHRFFIFRFPKHYRINVNVIFWLTKNSSFRNTEWCLFWFTKKSRSHSEISLLFPEEFTGNTFIQTCQIVLLKNDVARYLITRTNIFYFGSVSHLVISKSDNTQ